MDRKGIEIFKVILSNPETLIRTIITEQGTPDRIWSGGGKLREPRTPFSFPPFYAIIPTIKSILNTNREAIRVAEKIIDLLKFN
jgi:hypothetical protein